MAFDLADPAKRGSRFWYEGQVSTGLFLAIDGGATIAVVSNELAKWNMRVENASYKYNSVLRTGAVIDLQILLSSDYGKWSDVLNVVNGQFVNATDLDFVSGKIYQVQAPGAPAPAKTGAGGPAGGGAKPEAVDVAGWLEKLGTTGVVLIAALLVVVVVIVAMAAAARVRG